MNIKVNHKLSKPLTSPGFKPKPSHVKLFERLAAMPDDTRGLEKSLLILSTPRCGSTLFCEALNSCGQLGIAEEWFNYEYFMSWACVMGVTFTLVDYIEFLQKKSMRGTGVFVLNWHVGQIVEMNQDFNLGIESMDFDHIVYLYRRDKIAQAVSLCKAASSNQYRCYEEQKKKPKVSRHSIAAALEPTIKFDQFARKYLWKYVDASYAYEDFQRLGSDCTHPHHCYSDVLLALGKKHNHHHYSAGDLKKQANSDSVKAVEDFRRYITGVSE